MERYAFDKLVRLAIETGLLVKDAEQVLDSTPIHGAAALQDTYTLIRSGVHKLLSAMGEGDRARWRLAKRLKLEKYLSKRKPKLDWADSEARKAHLQELVTDAKRLLAESEWLRSESGFKTSAKRMAEGVWFCCATRISKAGEWCHRQVFSLHWTLRTRETVVELETGLGPDVADAEQWEQKRLF